MDYTDNVVGRGKRHQQQIMDESQLHLVMQVGQLAEENSRMDVRIDELERENRKIKALLERAKGVARMTLLERDGLVDVIKHLKKEWTPPENELHYKKQITPFVDKMVELSKNDPSRQSNVEDRLNYALAKE